jgi:4-diphosphocytidyl-2-C-methyl-D-erythritol kinase
MIVFPNCKINLGLHVIRKRSDGFHAIETIFYPVPLKDALEIVPAEQLTHITITGNTVPGNENDNSCIKAYHLLKKDFPSLPAASIHLHKAIPAGAGLGGGSADGAFMLMLLNNYFKLSLSQEQLSAYALQLGSDSPFFIINKPCLGTGRGEILSPAAINLAAYTFVIVNPGINVNTAWAFGRIVPKQPVHDILAIIKQPVENWKECLTNDFEAPIFVQYPEIEQIKNDLYKAGAVYASMSGSGSTVFGIFEPDKISLPVFPAHYFVKQL